MALGVDAPCLWNSLSSFLPLPLPLLILLLKTEECIQTERSSGRWARLRAYSWARKSCVRMGARARGRAGARAIASRACMRAHMREYAPAERQARPHEVAMARGGMAGIHGTRLARDE